MTSHKTLVAKSRRERRKAGAMLKRGIIREPSTAVGHHLATNAFTVVTPGPVETKPQGEDRTPPGIKLPATLADVWPQDSGTTHVNRR